jgi:TolB-like protein/Tfp pilus assembly protein PilF
MQLAKGDRLGSYEIVAPLGEGGMGEVYRAHDPRLGREVAVKVLTRAAGDDPSRSARLQREARLVAALAHPNVLTVHDVGDQDGVHYLVTELLEGETLRERLARRGALPWREVVDLGIAAARGVAAAHLRGIIHRDLKPENLFHTTGGQWKVLDFGLARLLDPTADGTPDADADTALTRIGTLLGTAAYMSPEQARGEPVDERTDLFALGTVLHEALTGRSPFRRDGAAATIAAVLAEDPPPLPAGLEAPPRLARLLERCLAKRREERPGSAEELAEALERLAAGAPAAVQASPSIAVLPFRDMSAARDQDYFCEGVADEILHSLTRVEGLRVAARTSSFQFVAGSADVREVAERLAVGHVLEGSVRRDGDLLRVTVQLVDAATGFHLWSERYDRASADVFAIQDEIAAGVAAKLSTGLSEAARSALRRRGTRDLAAYERYLRGRRLANEHRDRSLRAAAAEYEAALEIDPEFAAAWAALADCQTWLYFWHGHEPEALARAEEASARASELDPDGPEALAARGYVLSVAGRYAEADAAFEHALAAAPDFYEAVYQFARLRFVEGRNREAAELFERGARLEPDDHQCLALATMAYENLGDRERALDAARRTMARVERRVELAPGDARAFYLGAGAAIWLGDTERARAWAERSLALDPDEYPTLYNVACVHARLGETDRALDLLERAADTGFGHRAWFEHDPDFAALRDHPRFTALLAQLQ